MTADEKWLQKLEDALQRPTRLKGLKRRVKCVHAADQDSSVRLAGAFNNFFRHEDPTILADRRMLNDQRLVDVLRHALNIVIVRTRDRLVHDPDLDQADMREAERLLAKLGTS